MTVDFPLWANQVQRLLQALSALAPWAQAVGVSSPEGEDWYELLRHKLLPQLEFPPLIVAAVVGGTNIGKSVVFNHLAGEVASAVSPLAAGTKHPVCLVPEALADRNLLGRLFEPFTLAAWRSPQDALRDSPENLLFWRASPNIPPRLLALDAPDIDSDALINWDRARAIRQAADVLVAVLTQQKYNDAAVKQFFREAVAADKPILVVFNQVDLQADREYWPLWLDTFCSQTGAHPELVYVAPYDRNAAEQLRLPFYHVGSDGRRAPAGPCSLRDDLAALHFDAIKIRTFRGALARVLDAAEGVGSYLQAIRDGAADFQGAATALSAAEMARVEWPLLPAGVLVDEIRAWWDASRSPWSRKIHGFYRDLGRGLTWPARMAWNRLAGPQSDPLVEFHRREREALLLAVEKMLEELTRLSQVGNDTLRPRLAQRLGGGAREDLLARVEEAHGQLPAVDDDYRRFLWTELDTWKHSNTGVVSLLRSLDHVAAVARPAISITLAVSGWVLAGDLVGQVAVHAAQQTAGHLATEAVIAGSIAGGGEALVSTTSEGVGQAAARLFRRLQARYAQQRAAWLAAWLERELLGDLLGDLRRGAEAPQSAPFREIETIIQTLHTRDELP